MNDAQRYVAVMQPHVAALNQAATLLMGVMEQPDCPNATWLARDAFIDAGRRLFPRKDVLVESGLPLLSLHQIDALCEIVPARTVDAITSLGLLSEACLCFCDHAGAYVISREPDSDSVLMAWLALLAQVERTLVLLDADKPQSSLITHIATMCNIQPITPALAPDTIKPESGVTDDSGF